jgi:hypothetical protein
VLALQPRKAGSSACCAPSPAYPGRSLRSLYFPLPTRAPAGLPAPCSFSFLWGKALAFSASDKGPLIKSGLKGTRLAIKKIRKPCALQTPFGSLDIMAFIMSPCLLAKTLIALFFRPGRKPTPAYGRLPIRPPGDSPEKPQEKAIERKTLIFELNSDRLTLVL